MISDKEFEERLKKISNAMANPCEPGDHTYQHSVVPIGESTMLNQMCSKCFDVMGWIYDWEKPNQED
jgi:hypothetical protein